jgi:hypothetical protein
MSSKILALSISRVPGFFEGIKGNEIWRGRFLGAWSQFYSQAAQDQLFDGALLTRGPGFEFVVQRVGNVDGGTHPSSHIYG